MAIALPEVEREDRARLPSPARQVTVVGLAVLDITGVLVTIAAAVVLTLNDRTDRKWWWVVGLASLLAVLTTVLLIQIAGQRRIFIEDAERKVSEQDAERKALEEEAPEQPGQEAAPKSAEEQAYEEFAGVLERQTAPNEELRVWTHTLRDALVANGRIDLATRLTLAITKLETSERKTDELDGPERAEQEFAAAQASEEEAIDKLINAFKNSPDPDRELWDGARAIRDALATSGRIDLATRLTLALAGIGTAEGKTHEQEVPEQPEQVTTAPSTAEARATEELVKVLDGATGLPRELLKDARAIRDALVASGHIAPAIRLSAAIARRVSRS